MTRRSGSRGVRDGESEERRSTEGPPIDSPPTDGVATDSGVTDRSLTDGNGAESGSSGDGRSNDGPTVADVPDWEDEYVDRVSDRLSFNYDLEKGVTVGGERFALYGRMDVHSQKHFLHPALSYADHGSTEHLFARRVGRASVAECERLVSLGHDLAAEWIDADEEHYSTDFTFVLVVPEIPEAVREFVADFRDRTLLKLGFYGHYEINLVVVAPDREAIVASREAHVEEAFRLWDPIEREQPGLLDLIARRLQI